MFDPVRVCEILNEERVEFVVVGGLASVIHGSSLPTEDVDLVPSLQRENLDRLGRALERMNAKIRTDDQPVPAPIDGAFLANLGAVLNLVTDAGDVDVVFQPAGTVGGFSEWHDHSLEVEIADGVTIRIAALDDIIDSKRAANRAKDRLAIPFLESLRDERRER